MAADPTRSGPAATTRVRWLILALIVGVSFVAYVLRTNLSIVGPAMIAELGISEIQLGLVLSGFTLGYALFQFPGGVFGDLVGPRLAVTLILVATGLLTLATGLVPSVEAASITVIVGLLVVVRFLVGMVQAPVFPVMTGGMVSNWFPVAAWGWPNGLSSTGLTLGGAATGPLVVWLMLRFGWRGSFLLTAPLALALAALWWWTTRDYPAQHPAVSPGEQALVDAGRPPPLPAAARKGVWKAALANPDLLLLTASYFCMNYVFYLFFNWFFYYLVEVRGFPVEQAAALSAAQWIVGAVGAALGGLLCDRMMQRFGPRWGARLVPAFGLVASAVLLAGGAWAESPGLAVGLLAASFGCNQITDPGFWAATIAVGDRHAGSATGILNTGGNLVGFAGALLVPAAARVFGWPWAMASGALVALLGAVLWLWIRADRPLVVPAAAGA
ncbi:MAG: MFS transporter [Acidobacteriota bacterium]|nr:MFS transporter [Acidobacteriota bacterium]MDH3524035.1 MFS transporter [Acidobacteriota bacterium]